MAITYLNDADIQEVLPVTAPRSGQTITGYGKNMPTGYMIRIDNRLYRVYCICYGNSGSFYIKRYGKHMYFNNPEILKG